MDTLPVADLRGGVRDARPPPSASKFFQFHAVFGRIWQNCVFTPPPLGGFTPPPLGKSWIRHCLHICGLVILHISWISVSLQQGPQGRLFVAFLN